MRFLRLLLICGIVVAAFFFFTRSSFWSLQKVVVEGNSFLKPEEIANLSGLVLGQNLFTVKEEEVKRHLMAHPRIKAVDLRRHLPGTVVLQIEERQAVAVIPSGESFWQVDGDGILLGVVREWPQTNLLLTGVTLPALKPAPGQKMPLPGAGKILPVIKALPAEVREAMQEIHLANTGEAHLYTRNGIKVYLGKLDDLETKLVLFWAIYRQHAEEGTLGRLAYIDVSYPKAPALRYTSEGE